MDGVIPSPDNKMVDLDHLPIATAWQECRKALAAYDDMKDKHDTLMRRWEGMAETIRKKIDAGTITSEDRRLLDDLDLPHRYDRRTDTAQDGWQEIAPLTLEELKGIRREPVFIKYLRGNLPGEWKVIRCVTDRAVDFTDKTSLYLPDSSPAAPCYGRTWLAYRQKPEGCGK